MSPSPAADIRIGTILRDTYELTSLLGKGGMGSVFLARHLRLPGKQVAVKVLLHNEDLSPEQFARFRREAEIASQLGHPNIVEVLDFHSLEDGSPYMVMEYLRGESLAQRLRKGRLSLREAFSIARQMGSALQAAHRAGVVHRDLKPANVVLVPTESEGMLIERVKLLDFGISKLMGSQTLQTQEDVLMGTPRYMAPEQAMGRNKDVDARSDIFAFGCIVYEMLCGDSPFAGGTIAEVVYRVVHEQPESLASRVPDLPARAVAAVDKALAKAPKDRFADVATFIAELTGTPLQALAALGPDPTPLRGAIRQGDASVNEEDGTDATFVPSRSGVAAPAPAASPAPAPAAQPEPSVERGSTLAAFRAAEQEAAAAQPAPAPHAPTQTSSRRPTDVELPAAQAAAPAPVAPVPPAQPAARSKTPLIAAVVALVLVAGGLVVMRGMGTPGPVPTPSPSPPVAVTEPTPTPKTEPAPTPKTEPTPPATPVAVEPPPPSTPVASTTPEPKPPPSTPKGKPEVLPDAVRQELETAERALGSGDFEGAIRAAQRAQRVKKTEAATLMIGRAYCHQHDLSNARAQWRNLSAAGKSKLRAYCSKYDVSL
ncbi:serine/threonine-protein kinase [Hyalangium gracile]|uniref:serine/threonine-protein kinase n=1 Tax=Hyalangium gracile TaxID=394092 RepID=UPI001CCB0767|nr:serine/threonine-protein kinase [Hyalangium gracile]